MALTKIPAGLLDKSAHVDFADNEKLRLGTSQDLLIYHNGSNSYIDDVGTGALNIRSNALFLEKPDGSEVMASFTADGSADLYHNNVKKFETTAAGATVTGNLAVSGNLTVSGTTTELDTANLNVTDKNITLNYHASSDTSSNAGGAGITIQDAVNASTDATILWDASNDEFDFSHKISIPTLNTGTITSTGNLSMAVDNSTIYLGGGLDLRIWHDGGHARLRNTTGNFNIQANDFHITDSSNTSVRFYVDHNGATALYYDGNNKLLTTNTGVNITGTLQADNLTMLDNEYIRLGNSNDLQIFCDGTNGFIRNHVSGGSIYNRAHTNWVVQTNASDGGADDAIKALRNGAVELYYDGVKKLETKSTGLTVAGGISTNSSIHINYSGNDGMGVDSGLKIQNDGNDWGAYIRKASAAQYGLRIDSAGSHAFAIYSAEGGSDLTFSVTGSNGNVTAGAIASSAIASTSTIVADGYLRTKNYLQLFEGSTQAGGIFKEKSIVGSGSSLDMCIFAESISGGGDMHFMTGGSSTKRLTVQSGGNSEFGVDSSVTVQGTHNEGGGLIDLKGTDTPAANKNLGALNFGNSSDRSLAMIRGVSTAADAAEMRFFTEASGGAVEQAMVISSSRKVGIGLAVPLAKLHIKDTGAPDAFRVENYNKGIVYNSVSGNGMYSEYQLVGTAKFRMGQANHLLSGASVNDFALQAAAGDLHISRGNNPGTRFKADGDVHIFQKMVVGTNINGNGDFGAARLYVDNPLNNNAGLRLAASHASFGAPMLHISTTRTANTGFQMILARSAGNNDTEFLVSGTGVVTADGSISGGGADYAEYFEWTDGNSSNEDRVGTSVVLVANKVRPATADDASSTIIGVVSGNAGMVGDSDIEGKWKGKYLRDDYARYLLDSDGDKRLNPDFVEGQAYVQRENRKEWDTIGLMGKLRINKGQQIGTNWIKMRDVSDTVEEWLVK